MLRIFIVPTNLFSTKENLSLWSRSWIISSQNCESQTKSLCESQKDVKRKVTWVYTREGNWSQLLPEHGNPGIPRHGTDNAGKFLCSEPRKVWTTDWQLIEWQIDRLTPLDSYITNSLKALLSVYCPPVAGRTKGILPKRHVSHQRIM